ncbi:MAG: hypothetical protein ACYC55_06640 [Candidatus Geothermincolia bacterium]
MKTAQTAELLKDLHMRAVSAEDRLIYLYRIAEDLYYRKLQEHKVYERQFKEKVGRLANSVDYCIQQCRELEEFIEELALFKHGERIGE